MMALLLESLGKIALLFVSGVSLAVMLAGFERLASPASVGRSGSPKATASAWTTGMLTVLFDACKLACKADSIPAHATRRMFVLAPIWALCCAFVLGCLIPLTAPLCTNVWHAPSTLACDRYISLQVWPHDSGLLLFVAVSLASAFSVAMAGWASRNNWALLASLRALFQTVAFAVPMGLSVLCVAVMTGTLDLFVLADAQGEWPWQWGIWGLPHLLAFVVMWMALVVGVPRNPVHLDDGRSEMVGCLVEYAGLRAAVFRWAELSRAVFSSALIVTVFFGGWRFPGLALATEWLPSLAVVALSWVGWMAKVALACGLQMLARGSVARPRPDQVLDLVWRRVMPLGVLALVAAAVWRVSSQGAWP